MAEIQLWGRKGRVDHFRQAARARGKSGVAEPRRRAAPHIAVRGRVGSPDGPSEAYRGSLSESVNVSWRPTSNVCLLGFFIFLCARHSCILWTGLSEGSGCSLSWTNRGLCNSEKNLELDRHLLTPLGHLIVLPMPWSSTIPKISDCPCVRRLFTSRAESIRH